MAAVSVRGGTSSSGMKTSRVFGTQSTHTNQSPPKSLGMVKKKSLKPISMERKKENAIVAIAFWNVWRQRTFLREWVEYRTYNTRRKIAGAIRATSNLKRRPSISTPERVTGALRNIREVAMTTQSSLDALSARPPQRVAAEAAEASPLPRTQRSLSPTKRVKKSPSSRPGSPKDIILRVLEQGMQKASVGTCSASTKANTASIKVPLGGANPVYQGSLQNQDQGSLLMRDAVSSNSASLVHQLMDPTSKENEQIILSGEEMMTTRPAESTPQASPCASPCASLMSSTISFVSCDTGVSTGCSTGVSTGCRRRKRFSKELHQKMERRFNRSVHKTDENPFRGSAGSINTTPSPVKKEVHTLTLTLKP